MAATETTLELWLTAMAKQGHGVVCGGVSPTWWPPQPAAELLQELREEHAWFLASSYRVAEDGRTVTCIENGRYEDSLEYAGDWRFMRVDVVPS